jgi:hypothetical protein
VPDDDTTHDHMENASSFGPLSSTPSRRSFLGATGLAAGAMLARRARLPSMTGTARSKTHTATSTAQLPALAGI